MVDDAVGGTPSSKEGISKKWSIKKWSMFLVVFGLSLGFVGLSQFPPDPDAAGDFDDISDYEEACHEALVSNPQWYEQNGCEEHLDFYDEVNYVTFLCCGGLLLPIIGCLTYIFGPQRSLQGYWDGSKVISVGPFGKAKSTRGVSNAGSPKDNKSGYLPSAPEQQKKSFNEKMLDARKVFWTYENKIGRTKKFFARTKMFFWTYENFFYEKLDVRKNFWTYDFFVRRTKIFFPYVS